jgi:hypothetical protein
VVLHAAPQPAAVEERRTPIVAEAQPAAPVAVAPPAASTVEGQRAPAVAETRLEAVAAAPRRELAALEARAEASVEAQQGPAPVGGSRAVVVEIPDDDSPPPGWDQWVSFPTPSPESQEGALVRRRDDHMVAGGRGHGAEASSSRAGRSAPGEGHVSDPPAFADAQEEQELWGELRDHGAVLNRALNEALRIHGGPAWRVFQVRRRRLFS